MPREIGEIAEVLDERWGSLSPATPIGMRVSDLPSSNQYGAVRAGLDARGRHLLIPVEKDGAVREDRRGAAVQVRRHALEEGDKRTHYLDLVCLRSEAYAPFSTLCAEVLIELESRGDDAVAEPVSSVLSAWRRLFAVERRVLSIKELAGLAGELLFLRLLGSLEPAAVDHWKGPQHSSHDFVCPGGDVEVKTTLGDSTDVVRIHGVNQLLQLDGGHLFLVRHRLEQIVDDEEGWSFVELVDEVANLVGWSALKTPLAEAGFAAIDRERYAHQRFTVLESTWFRVTEGFPRLTESSAGLPEGISRVDYDLDLARATEFLMAEEEIDDAVGLLLG